MGKVAGELTGGFIKRYFMCSYLQVEGFCICILD